MGDGRAPGALGPDPRAAVGVVFDQDVPGLDRGPTVRTITEA
jgi:hypothetical protein